MKFVVTLRRIGAALLVGAIAAVDVSAQSSRAPRVVDIQAADSVVLKATLFPSARSGPSPAVLLLHQCDEQRKVWDPLGARLAQAGMTVLSLDYRGYGESGGTPHEQLAPAVFEDVQAKQWPADIELAFAFLSKQPGVDTTRMAAGGGSCGVNSAVHLAMRHGNVKALALLAGGTNRAARKFLASPGAPPIFVAAAGDDQYADFVSIMGWYAAQSANPQTRMAQYRDGGHAAVMFRAHPGLADTIATWFAVVMKIRGAELPRTNGIPMQTATMRVLEEIDRAGGAAAVTAQLTAARARNPAAQLFPEYFVNQLGYEHFQVQDLPGALAIMKLNVLAYPASPNAMDSLGDIYLAMGDQAAALKAARETLLLLAKDTADSEARKQDIRSAAEDKIKRLGGS